MITKEFLQSEIRNLQAQKQNAMEIYHQATGAIQAYETLVQKISAAQITTNDHEADNGPA